MMNGLCIKKVAARRFVLRPLIGILVLCAAAMPVACAPSKAKAANAAKSEKKTAASPTAAHVPVAEKPPAETADMKKLTKLLSEPTLLFSDVKGEARPIVQRISAQKELFLADVQAVLAADTEDLLIRVDKTVYLDSSYVPPALVPLTAESAKAGSYAISRGDLSLRAPVEKELARMARAAREDGVTLLVSSSYRPYAYQKKVYERNVAQMGKEAADRESARPGASQHQLGTVIDFGSISDAYAETKAGKWLYAHAGKYGWSLSFPDGYEFVTGYRWECWHYRYIGPLAVRFQEKWFNNVQQYMIEFIHAWKQAD